MADARITQPSFTAGEIAPELYARKDLARYQVGLRKLLNGFVLPTGGVSNRAGTRFAAEVPDSTKNARITSFQAAANDAFLLVWGDLVVRPMSFGAYIDDGGSPYEVDTPYAHTQLKDLYQEQSNDVATLAHPLFTPYELKRFDVTDWRMEPVSFVSDVAPPDDLTAVATRGYTDTSGGRAELSYSYKVASISPDGEEGLPTPAAPVNTPLMFGFDANWVTLAWSSDAISLASMPPPSRTNANGATIFPRSITLSNNRTVTHIGVWSSVATAGKIKIAERTGAGAYTIVADQAVTHGGGGWQDFALAVPYVVPAAGTFYMGFNPTAANVRISRGQSIAWTNGDPGLGATALTEDNDSEAYSLRVTYALVPGAAEVKEFAVYRERNGSYGRIGVTPDVVFIDRNLAPDYTLGPQDGFSPFEGTGKFPSIVTFAQQRRVFAKTVEQPQTLWMTQSGNFKNMSKSSPVRDDDSIEVTLAARQKQDIFHIVPLEAGMIVFTRSGEWKVVGRDGDIITPSTINPQPQSSHGCAQYLKPIVVGENLLFAPRTEDGAFEMEYSIQIDRYKANDLTVLSRHLFEGRRIVAWDYAKKPHGIIYCVLDDGTALTLTYLKDHEVWGWGRQDTKGKFQDVAVVSEGGRDVPYFIVERRIGGVAKKYIEFMAERRIEDARDAFFVDCGASLDVPVTIASIAGGATTTLTKTAHGLANGDEVELSGVYLYDADGELVHTLDGRWIVAGVTANTFRITYKYDNEEADPPISAGDDVVTNGWSYYDGTGIYRKAVMTVTGLDHLNGRKAVALCDGNVVEDLTIGAVTGGIGVTFDRKYARVHVGLSFRSVFTTLDLLNPQGDDTGIVKGNAKWLIRVEKSRGFKLGRTEEEAVELPPRDDEDYGEPASLKSGLFPIDLWSEWSTDQPIAVVQDYPLPVTMLSMTTEAEYGGTE